MPYKKEERKQNKKEKLTNEAAEKLAEILIMQLECNKSKIDNLCKKEK